MWVRLVLETNIAREISLCDLYSIGIDLEYHILYAECEKNCEDLCRNQKASSMKIVNVSQLKWLYKCYHFSYYFQKT